jgi:PAS domain S-box-containing protein
MQGWGWEKVHHPDHIGHVMAFVKEAWKRDEPFELTFPLRRHDGVYRWFLTRAVPVKNEAGTIYRWIGTNTDIHEQKMAEERFRTLAETLPQLVWMTDAAGTYEYASHHWQEYSGIDPRSENAWVKIVHPEDLGPLTEVWLRCLATGETYRADVRLINNEGEYRWHFVRGEPVRDEQGKIMKWIGAFTDNHEQRTMTEKLEGLVTQRTKELQRSNEDLQQFAHVASHDLKEPLRKIRTFGSRLNHEFGDTLPEQAKVYLAKIEAAAARMYAMIDGVLNYSTLNITDQIVERVDLNEVMRNIEADLEVVIQQKNAVIEYGHLPALEGSAVLLNQLFYNLVYNSLKFSNTHITPKILITAAPLSGTAAARDWNLDVQATYVQLTVQDNGIGFSQDQAERIFKTFTRLNAKDKYEGTGLGLALCKKIAERHNGAISAAGMEGMGAIFKVVLPLQQTRKTD